MSSTSALPFDIASLQVLMQLAERGSVQAAAHRLGVSRATVRRRIEELEEAVGESLVHRGAQGAQLTRAGQVLAERGRHLIDGVHDALSDARFAATEATGLVRILMPVGMQLQLVSELLARVRAADFDVRVVIDEHSDPASQAGDKFDLMFHFGPPPPDPLLFSRVLRRAPLMLVASPDYLEAHGTPERPEDLTRHTLLVWQGLGRPTDQLPLRTGGAIRIQPWLATPDITLLRRMAALGVGIALAPDGNLPDEPGVGPLVQVLPDVVGRQEAFRATSPLPSRVDPRAAEFVERVHAMLHAMPEH